MHKKGWQSFSFRAMRELVINFVSVYIKPYNEILYDTIINIDAKSHL